MPHYIMSLRDQGPTSISLDVLLTVRDLSGDRFKVVAPLVLFESDLPDWLVARRIRRAAAGVLHALFCVETERLDYVDLLPTEREELIAAWRRGSE